MLVFLAFHILEVGLLQFAETRGRDLIQQLLRESFGCQHLQPLGFLFFLLEEQGLFFEHLVLLLILCVNRALFFCLEGGKSSLFGLCEWDVLWSFIIRVFLFSQIFFQLRVNFK